MEQIIFAILIGLAAVVIVGIVNLNSSINPGRSALMSLFLFPVYVFWSSWSIYFDPEMADDKQVLTSGIFMSTIIIECLMWEKLWLTVILYSVWGLIIWFIITLPALYLSHSTESKKYDHD